MNDKLLHFSIGPVQGFIAQARRTRDLWAGSFLLSWMAGQAMAAVRRQGGSIEFPAIARDGGISDPLMAAIEGAPLDRDYYPQIGSLPNRFKATVPDKFDAEAVERAVHERWQKLADAVWDQFVATAADKGHNTRAIWDRQINGFWEMAWVLGQAVAQGVDSTWLDARKNWRKRWPEPEGGDHCAMMGAWQELSGFIRSRERSKQDAFWKELAAHTGELELRDNERLCAIALIKRLFPRLNKGTLEQTIGWVPGGAPEAIGNWPSTAYLAVIPWLREVAGDDARTEQLRSYESRVINAAGNAVRGERSTRINSLQPLKELAWLDGNFFLPTALANANDTPLSGDETARSTLGKALKALQSDHPVQPYYALLLLDGDNLGRHLGSGDPGKISTSLAAFSDEVVACVAQHDGVTLYAGGDDVMALLSYDRALDCAVALRQAYGEAFADAAFTASVAVVFAHYHLPLREVLAEGHHQLDAIAKERNGRDSIALAWFKASGKAAEWVSTWADDHDEPLTQRLQTLVNAVRQEAFGSGFFYKLRTRYPMLADPDVLAHFPSVEHMLQAEYLKTRERKPTLEQARKVIDEMLFACRGFKRDQQGEVGPHNALQLDGLRLARLLAGKEVHQ